MKRALALVALEDYARAADELGQLLPELEGKDRLEALLARGRATHWSERDLETIEMAEQALALAEELVDEEAIPAALALLSPGQCRCAERRAISTGRSTSATGRSASGCPALGPSTGQRRCTSITTRLCWTGAYERAVELAREGRKVGRRRSRRGARAARRRRGKRWPSRDSAGSKRHSGSSTRSSRSRATSVATPESSSTTRRSCSASCNDLAEARRRSAEALELSEGMAFSMPRSFAGADLVLTDLLAGNIGAAKAGFETMWRNVENATAWTRWLIYGRLLAARAEIALAADELGVGDRVGQADDRRRRPNTPSQVRGSAGGSRSERRSRSWAGAKRRSPSSWPRQASPTS